METILTSFVLATLADLKSDRKETAFMCSSEKGKKKCIKQAPVTQQLLLLQEATAEGGTV